ncbi:hydroxyisourate hydrolase [Salegentibacter sp. BLCTC]|uniref:hydroxyisourate hydrolase n=1 Tax=Salegentibacter sp. BLCTC TaxID=2697368 RepID=UPI00187B6B5E|nr:hydroxyisourate hydrolase [Salegentibacter sp. BLCTC]MBE7640067.1 hydroxyisourate hydrolase [Salegentibacter sp. BLCTC]
MKRVVLTFGLFLLTSLGFAQEDSYQLSTHILDISEGAPAANVAIKLEKRNNKTESWDYVSENLTAENGRVNDFLPAGQNNNGIYKFTFFVNEYYKEKGKETFYPFIEVVFEIKDEKHYHVPITLSAFGYSTYRGS